LAFSREKMSNWWSFVTVSSRSPACREHVAKCNVTVANGRWCSPDFVTRREEVAKSSPNARWEVAEVAGRSLSIELNFILKN
jgi:hypothetical protein